MLLLEDHWTWDFWFTTHGRDIHLFFLKAPRDLGDPDLRHQNARIGHAVSQDLRTWTVLPDALAPGAAGAWDDMATWTGSVLKVDGGWSMFYTGISRSDNGLRQRIGRADSADLITWTKDEHFVLEADPAHFEQLDTTVWPDLCWRDPCVFADPDNGGYAMLVTARVPHGPVDGRGVVGLLRSDDLRNWTVIGPVTEPGDFGHLEVPQVVAIGGRHYLVFCAYAFANSAARAARVGRSTGTHYYVGDSATGPFKPWTDELFAADEAGSMYAGKIVRDPATQDWAFMGFLQHDVDGTFIGALSDPVPIDVRPDGGLSLRQPVSAQVGPRTEARRPVHGRGPLGGSVPREMSDGRPGRE
ncbi:glycosyl hydrolase family 32 [Micromonospora sp. NPDC048930]|uniref:glycosyl hydrolase family 32 n=1 Tax=Micromonospora sp. NPDC048930 TaxID=3364261 RepID=UPI0037135E47